ncbi:hypothetical protein [Arcobacter sp. F155]|uniref:hypothetical protein n=1 Tax=Arcobacter sp. F155 TaxID=2044512 RepID=UPI0013E9562E|nr:hypothetical protein [Arcobacter sp. F155]
MYLDFEKKCEKLTNRANKILVNKHSIQEWEFNYLSENLLSDLWQAWCLFCKKILILSCQGTKDRNNLQIPKLSSPDLSTLRLSYEVSANKSHRNPTANGHLSYKSAYDITWGDTSKLIDAINFLSPHNHNTLITAFGSTAIINDIQLTRNFSAHKNKDTLTNCRGFLLSYNLTNVKSPTDIIWSTHNDTGEFAILCWIFYCQLIADNATS